MKHLKKIIVLLVVVAVIALYFKSGIDLNELVGELKQQLDSNYLYVISVFFVAYIAVAALNLPGAGVLTIGAGIIFGLGQGLLVVSFASTIGATLSMLIARTLLQDWVRSKFSSFCEKVDRGVEEDGASYLFTLRLIPVIPFFVVNPAFGLTKMPAWKFFVVSQLGMLPGTAIYVNLGATVGSIDDFSILSILTPQLVAALVLLIAFPFIAKRVMNSFKTKQKLKGYKKPKRFDANLVVVGAGAAGLVSSYIAALVKAKVYLIEKHRMGGDCLNTGCVPSKAIIRSAKVAHQARKAQQYGVETENVQVDFKAVMDRVQNVVKKVEPHDSVERYEGLGVNCIQGEAEIISPYEVRVGDKTITTKKIIVAAGARPRVPPIPGLEEINYRTSDTLWSLDTLPKKLLVVGGGAIGCELTHAFSRLGSEVTIVERAPRLIPAADKEVGDFVKNKFASEDINVLVDVNLDSFSNIDGRQVATLSRLNSLPVEEESQEAISNSVEIEFDMALIALGREANTEQSLFKHLSLEKNPNGTLKVDQYLQTSVPGVYACGDIVGPYQFTHAAAHQAWYASVNALFGVFKKFKVNYDVLPWVVFCDPEIAHVGATEDALVKNGTPYEATLYDLSDLDRAITEDEDEGFVKVLTSPKKGKILGATIIGSRAGEMINEFAAAMKFKKTLNDLMGVVHSYPTFSEANKYAAGVWKANNKPEKALGWLSWLFKKGLKQ